MIPVSGEMSSFKEEIMPSTYPHIAHQTSRCLPGEWHPFPTLAACRGAPALLDEQVEEECPRLGRPARNSPTQDCPEAGKITLKMLPGSGCQELPSVSQEPVEVTATAPKRRVGEAQPGKARL